MREIGDPMIRDLNWELPARLAGSLMDEQEVYARLGAGESAVELSIDKWTRLRDVVAEIRKEALPSLYFNALKENIGYRTCALCIRSVERFTELHGRPTRASHKCTVCPLGSIDRCVEEDSTFAEIDRMTEPRRVRLDSGEEANEADKLLRLCERMISSLEKI
jgi:hypothetical protein